VAAMTNLIPFNDWSQERIQLGMKICTSRHKRYKKDPRVTFITGKLPWWIIVNYLYEAEGARNPKELQEVIDGIYGRHVPDDEMFYVHFGDFKS
jgi:hypothetical protein